MDRSEPLLLSAVAVALALALLAPTLGAPAWIPMLVAAAAGVLAAAWGAAAGLPLAAAAVAIGWWEGEGVPALAAVGVLGLLWVALGATARAARRRRQATLATWFETARTLLEAHEAREATAALPALASRLVGRSAATLVRRAEHGLDALTPVEPPPEEWPQELFDAAAVDGWAEAGAGPPLDGRTRVRRQLAVALPGPEAPTVLWLQTPARRLPRGARERLRQWARVAGAGLARLEAMDRLVRAAYTDPLTGLGSRRAFEERLREEMARALRYGHPLSLVLLDLDGFKQINDTRGHPEGDRLLRLVAQTLRRTRREADLLFRWGGDEFAVLLPNTPSSGARQAALRYAEAVEGASGPLRLRACVGYAGTDEGHAHPAELVRAADDRLYAQKAASRTAG